MNIVLYRWDCSSTRNLGVLHADGLRAYTMERPWVRASTHLGGKPFESCVPSGTYALEKFTRSSGAEVYALYNPDLGVYIRKDDIPQSETGRYEILIHPANYVEELAGCIAPGLAQGLIGQNEMVSRSGDACGEIFPLLDCSTNNTIGIRAL
tara:strand:+ start:3204 stop:3659 length:456 start_codon:yes stop_codon:yes gene_type:complete